MASSGPDPHHWFYGSLLQLMNLPDGEASSEWLSKYSPTVSFLSIFRRPEIMTADPTATAYISAHTELFDRVQSSRRSSVAATAGTSLFFARGEDRKRLRKIMVPSFGPAQIRQLLPVFLVKSYQLKDRLLSTSLNEEGKGKEVDIRKWMERVSTDIIGLAGFDYDFESINNEGNELLEAWNLMQKGFGDRSWISMIFYTGVPLAGRFIVSSA